MTDITGTNSGDTWTNDNTNNRYFGLDGNDTMTGGNGTGVLFPGSNAAANGEWIYGGNGNDLYYGNGSNDVFADQGTGNDSMYGGTGSDTMNSGVGNDSISVGAGDNYAEGGIGNDNILAGDTDTGANTMYGGAGTDTEIGGIGADLLYGGDDNDNIVGARVDTLADGADSIYGDGGDDYIQGQAGADLVYGGVGNDAIIGDGASASVGQNDSLYGDEGNDRIWAGGGNDLVSGGADDDRIFGDDGADSLYGDAGNDSVFGGNGNDTLFGGADNDQVLGDAGDDSLSGDTGNDILWGGADNDSISGGTGNDYIEGEAGDDTLTGGAGDDIFVWDGSSNDIITDFGVDSGGPYDDANQGNNDFVDLTTWYSTGTVGAANGAGGTFVHQLDMLKEDAADGVVDGIINGVDYRTQLGITGSLTVQGSAPLNFDTTGVACFTTGTLIKTEGGEVAIEKLSAGAEVLTLDNGYQPVRWIGSRHLSAEDLAAQPNLRPIRIRAGALGINQPETDLVVSPQHRVLVRSKVAERMFGEAEVLMAAKHLLALPGIEVAEDMTEVTYWHFLCDTHQVVFSNGAATESLHTGPEALKSISPEALEEVLTLFPGLAADADNTRGPVRLLVPGRPARKFAERVARNGNSMVA